MLSHTFSKYIPCSAWLSARLLQQNPCTPSHKNYLTHLAVYKMRSDAMKSSDRNNECHLSRKGQVKGQGRPTGSFDNLITSWKKWPSYERKLLAKFHSGSWLFKSPLNAIWCRLGNTCRNTLGQGCHDNNVRGYCPIILVFIFCVRIH